MMANAGTEKREEEDVDDGRAQHAGEMSGDGKACSLFPIANISRAPTHLWVLALFWTQLIVRQRAD